MTKQEAFIVLQNKKLIELSHLINPASPTWEGEAGFSAKTVFEYSHNPDETQFCVQKIFCNAGIGTHIDAPAHCIPGGRTIDQLSLDELLAPCFVIDGRDEAKAGAKISLRTVQKFEQEQNVSFHGSIVFIHTGWSLQWSNPAAYRNNLHFPALSADAARYLIEQGIVALGIDTLGPDRPGKRYLVHEIVLGANRYLIENVANLNQLAERGAWASVMPLRGEGLTEAPIRLVGIVSRD